MRPPRLGGNTKVGVFATRSTHRPNRLGLSVGKIVSIQHNPKDETSIRVAGLDLLHGTPIVDIKPYLGWSDSVSAHESGFAQATPDNTLQVEWTETALRQIEFLKVKPKERATIEAVLALTPALPTMQPALPVQAMACHSTATIFGSRSTPMRRSAALPKSPSWANNIHLTH